jgi:serine/threonine protein kinase/tetratricopeptide (TPR) repeat protein
VNRDEWARVQEVFEQAAALPSAEREAFLAAACPDPGLRREVESLLKADQDSAPLEEALRDVASSGVRAAAAKPREHMIGDYRIIRQLGAGGMGLVYEAEQQHPKRVVALKVIRGGRYVDDQQVRLFQREAQALARLRHPAIASIFESGRTVDGQHFFAMELVRGERLSDYVKRVDREKSSKDALEIKLQLFVRVCDAVTYAHQRGVIHRDLKPANVVVQKGSAAGDSSASNIPGIKILDFGLARMTESDLAASAVVTSAGLIQGSLAYMSPEQASGNSDEIDLRTDIYSLGVMLYEIVAARLPQDQEGRSVPEAIRALSEDPPRPLTLPDGSRIPDRDLETIAFKALEKEPQNRYQSVAALAGDVGRYLAQQPILARPPSTVYQLRKLVSRHRTAFGFTVVLLAVLVAFAATMAYQARRIAQERDRANLEAGTAKEISDFLIDLFSVSDPGESRGNTVTARELLDKGAGRIDSTLTDRPRVQARLMDTMGRVYRTLGLYDRADALLVDAIRIRRGLPGEDEALATSLFNRAELMHYQQKLNNAEAAYKEALQIQRRVLGEESLAAAHTIDLLGRLYRDKRDYEQATVSHERALAIRKKLQGPRSLEVADSLHSLAMIAHSRNEFDKAEAYFREEYAIYQAQQIDRPALLNNLGVTLTRQAKYDEAEKIVRQVVPMTRRMYGDHHPFHGMALRTLGVFLLHSRGDPSEAEPLLRQSLAIMKASGREAYGTYAGTALALADLLREKGELQDGEALARAVLKGVADNLGDRHPSAAEYWSDAAGVLLATGKIGEAEALLDKSMSQMKDAAPDLPLAGILVQLGRLRAAQSQRAQAEKALNEALAIRTKILPDHHLLVAEVQLELGRSLTHLARYDEAEAILLQAMTTRRRHLGAVHRWTVESRDALAALYRVWGKPDKLERLAKQG